jgi:hypothetical protein
MKRLFLLGIFIIIGVSAELQAAGWSESVGSSRFPGLQFRWRHESVARSDAMNFIEFEFRNTSDDKIEFFYVVGTDSGEVAYGRIDLEATDSRLLGWQFAASSIVFFETTDPDSATALLDELGLVEYQPEAAP